MKKHVLDPQMIVLSAAMVVVLKVLGQAAMVSQRQYRGHSPRLHLHLHLHLRNLHMKKHVLDRQQRQYRGHSPRLHLHLHLLAQTAKQQALAQA
jgi:hypothetical protein